MTFDSVVKHVIININNCDTGRLDVGTPRTRCESVKIFGARVIAPSNVIMLLNIGINIQSSAFIGLVSLSSNSTSVERKGLC